jgi:hypothetical protein
MSFDISIPNFTRLGLSIGRTTMTENPVGFTALLTLSLTTKTSLAMFASTQMRGAITARHWTDRRSRLSDAVM